MITEHSAGFILVLRKDGEEDKFLLIKQLSGNWSFPKGHLEEGEDSKTAAIRELQEETGITEFKFAELPTLIEEYDFNHSGDIRHKVNEYFIAYALQVDVKIQEGEIVDFKWVTYDEAMETFTFDDQKVIMKEVRKYLDNLNK
ncbi:MAG: NUDIX domain-containing protein [Candidatus Paceibacterota bacterium]